MLFIGGKARGNRIGPADHLQARRDLAVTQVRIVAAVAADDLERACMPVSCPAAGDARGLSAQDGGATMTGPTSPRERHVLSVHPRQPWITGIIRCRGCGDRIRTSIVIVVQVCAAHPGPPDQQIRIPPGSGAALVPESPAPFIISVKQR